MSGVLLSVLLRRKASTYSRSALKRGKNAYHYIWQLDKLWWFQERRARERERKNKGKRREEKREEN